MLRQIKLLLKCQLTNLFGINEVRYTKDKKEKARFFGLLAVWILLGMMILSYVGGISYLLIQFKMEAMVPQLLFAVRSRMIFFFSFLKAGNVIFQMNSYEILITFPVSKAAIVISRFLTMYVTNLLLGLLIMIPGMAIYGIFVRPGVSFYFFCLIGILFLPMFPLTVATILGAGIMAISSKMRNKNLVQAILMILLTLVLLVGSMNVSDMPEHIDKEVLKEIISSAEEKVSGIYPPAVWFADAANSGKFVSFLIFLMVSVGVLFVLMFVLQKHFFEVCSALREHSAKKNYKMESLTTASTIKALWKKEVKRYFSSSIYMGNTMIGYLMMIVMGVAMLAIGIEKIEASLPMTGMIKKILPFLFGAMAGIMPTTSCAVSMEGKQWWIAQTLPIQSKDIWNSKILFNLTIALPCYFISLIFVVLAAKPTAMEAVFLVVLPLAYIVFTAVAGITVNLTMPVFDWENEMHVVKQSASVLVTMLVGLISVVVPIVLVIVCKDEVRYLIYTITTLVLVVLIVILSKRNNRKTVNL